MLGFWAIREAKSFALYYLNFRLNKIFKGESQIESIGFENYSLLLHRFKVFDITQKGEKILFSVKKVDVPIIPIFLGKAEINLIGFHLNLYKKEKEDFNIIDNLYSSNRKKRSFFKIPSITLFIKQGSANVQLSIKKKPFLFVLSKAKGSIGYQDGRIFFSVKGKEKTADRCSSKGMLNLEEKTVYILNKFFDMPIEDPFSRRLFSTLLPLSRKADFKGDLDIHIILSKIKKEWQPTLYKFLPKGMDLIPNKGDWSIRNFFGEIALKRNSVILKEGYFDLLFQKILYPLKNTVLEAMFDKKKIKFETVKAKIFGGDFLGNCEIRYNEFYKIYLNFKDLDMVKLDNTFFKRKLKGWQGVISLDALLASSKKEAWKFKALGEASIRDSNLFDLPLFIGMFDFLNFKIPKQEKISTFDTAWRYGGNDLYFNELKISSQNSTFLGNGVYKNLNELDFDLAIQLKKPKLFSLAPLIGDLTLVASNLILGNLMGIKVSGSLNEPKFQKVPLKNIPAKLRGLLNSIFRPGLQRKR
ncbi:hypothetical protein ACFLQ1_00145 [Candidatus Auribacterota bacterium]